MKRVWITGAGGFVGRYVRAAVEALGLEALCTDVMPSEGVGQLDICDRDACTSFAKSENPDCCIHLAGIAFVPDAARNPQLLDAVNVQGVLNVANALTSVAPGGRFLFVSTAQVYGPASSDSPLRESDAVAPSSPYAQSKARAEKELLALSLPGVVVARPGNHTGPGQSPKFVVPSFISNVMSVRRGEAQSIRVGNLDSRRSFSDVRDIVAAYLLLLALGKPGEIYNISSPKLFSIGEVLGMVKAELGVDAPFEVDKALWRPTDSAPILDTSKIAGLGWSPRYVLPETIHAMCAEALARA